MKTNALCQRKTIQHLFGLTLMFLMLLFANFGWGQTTVSYDFSAVGAVTGLNEAAPGVALDANIGFGSFKNSGTVNPALNSGQLRLYQNATKGGSIKIYASNGVTITKVVVHASDRTGPAAYSVDGVGSTAISISSGSYTISGLTATSNFEFWQKDENLSNRIYVDKFDVTYTSGGGDVTPPSISSLSPADNAVDVAINTDLLLIFDENVQAGLGNVMVKTISDGTTIHTIDITGNNVTIVDAKVLIDIPSDLANNTAYYIEMASGVIEDLSGNGYAGISGSTIWNFITVTAPNDADTDVYSGSRPAASLIASTSTTFTNVFVITIEDLGTADGLVTDVTNIRFKPHTSNTADWTDHILDVKLNNGSDITTGSPTITDTYIDIPITSGNLEIADGTSGNITLQIQINNTGITDGAILSFMVDADAHGFTSDASGSDFASAFALGDFNSNDFTIEVTATELQFVQQPSNVNTGTNISPAVTLAFTDANGNYELDLETADVSIIASGATLNGSPVVSVIDASGVAAFSTLQFSTTGTGVTLTASDKDDYIGTSETVTSTTFDVSASSAGGCASDLIISEVVEKGNDKYVEIANFTGSGVDLSSYGIVLYVNGSGSPGSEIGLSSTTLADGDVWVFANTNFSITADQTSGSYTPNGNDVIALRKNGENLDVFGTIGNSSDWYDDKKFIRNSSVTDPTISYASSEWIITAYGGGDPGTLGDHTMDCGSFPLLTVSPATLSGFTYEVGSGPSSEQSFTVSGSDLGGNDVTITAPVNYIIYTTSGSSVDASPIILSAFDGTETIIYVRLKTGLAVGTYNDETISISGGGDVNTYNVTCSGEVTEIPTPTLTVSPLTLTGFTYEEGCGPSSEQSFTISGTGLDGTDVTVDAASLNYEVSTDNVTFGASAILSYTKPTLNGTVYVRLKKDLVVGGYNNEDLSIGGGGDVSAYSITCSGNVIEVSLTCGTETFTNVSGGGSYELITWTGDEGGSWSATEARGDVSIDGQALCFKGVMTSPIYSGGVGDITMTTKYPYSDGTGTLNVKVNEVSVGTVPISTSEQTVTITGANVGGDVEIKIEDAEGKRAGIDNLTWTCYEACSIPTTQASDFVFSNVLGTQMDVSFTSGDGDGRILVISTNPIIGAPVDNATYIADNQYDNGQGVLGAGEYVVYNDNGSGLPTTITGLSANTLYHFAVFEYGCSAGSELYLTPAFIGSQGTTNYVGTGVIVGPICVTATLTASVSVPFAYVATSAFSGATFTAQLSDVLGDFTSPTNIGTIASDESGSQTITATIPAGTPTGTGYRIRVNAASPDITGADNNTDLTISLSPVNASSFSFDSGNTEAELSWIDPLGCFDEVLVVMKEVSSISGIPVGDGSAYGANVIFGNGTTFDGGYVVYKGSGTTVTVTGLTNGNEYYARIYTRYGNDWSSGQLISFVLSEQTIFQSGDVLIVGFDTYAGSVTDVISLMTMVNIETGTEFYYANIAYELNAAANDRPDTWWSCSGSPTNALAGYKITYSGIGLNAGDVITFDIETLAPFNFRVNGVSTSDFVATLPDGWYANANLSTSAPDAVFVMQGEFTGNSGPATFDGVVIGGIMQGANWFEVSDATTGLSGDDLRRSRRSPQVECFAIQALTGGSGTPWAYYDGPKTGIQNVLISAILDQTNWQDGTDASGTINSELIDNAFTVTPGVAPSGKWTGSDDLNWFNCRNWANLAVPNETVNVTISASTGNLSIDPNAASSSQYEGIAKCKNLVVESQTITVDEADEQLHVYGNLTLQAGAFIDLDDNDAGTTADGNLILYGNFDNQGGDASLIEGNGTIWLNGLDQTLTLTEPQGLGHLKLSNSGTKSINQPFTAMSVTVENNAVLDPQENNFSVSGDWSSYGEAAFNETNTTVTFNGSEQQTITTIGGEVFSNLIISNNSSDGVVLGDNLTVSGLLDLGANGVLKPGATTRYISLLSESANMLLGSGTSIIDLSSAAHVLNIACESLNFSGTLTGGALSTVNYNRNGNQTVMEGANVSYASLMFAGSGIKYTNDDLNIVDFTIDGATFDAGTAAKALTLTGNMTIQNSGSMSNTLTNIDLLLDGGNNQIFRGNGVDFQFNDILGVKTAGNITFSNTGGTSNLISNHDIAIDLAGGNLTDNGNTLEAGDDIEIGNGGVITLTGMLKLNASNVADGDIHLSAHDGIAMFPASINSLTVGGAFELYPIAGGGTFDINGNVVIENAATFGANGNNLNVGGNWTTYGYAGFAETGVDVTFNGAANQTITSGDSETFEDLIVNKSGGNLLLADNVTTQTLTLTSGKIQTGSQTLTVSSTSPGDVSGYTTSNYVNGNLARYVDANGSYDFPVGGASNYELANINLVSSSGISYITTSFISGMPGGDVSHVSVGLPDPTPITGKLDAGFWTITPDAVAAVEYNITLTSRGHSVGGGQAQWHTILKRANIGSEWESEGVHLNGTQTGSGVDAITAVRSTLTSFSDFLIAYGNAPLPVDWLGVSVAPLHDAMKVKWQTSQEINNDYFDVEHSLDNVNYSTVGRVEGTGISNVVQDYSFIHRNPLLGVNYYRIKQVDFDGAFDHSKVVAASWGSDMENTLRIEYIFTDATQQTAVVCYLPEHQFNVEIFDISGNLIYTAQQTADGYFTTIDFSSAELKSGLYIFTVSGVGESVRQKFVVR